MAAMLHDDVGVWCAPTAFGKTVTAAGMIARRGVNTLILVHRTELLKQWQERLQTILEIGKGVVGTIGGGKSEPTGKIDIAVRASLSRQGEVNPLVESFGQIIIDECHHMGAASFDAILKKARAKYVLGLTATPDCQGGAGAQEEGSGLNRVPESRTCCIRRRRSTHEASRRLHSGILQQHPPGQPERDVCLE